MKNGKTVQVKTGEIVLPTYMPAPPDKNPMFLEKRVYQGSSGRVYPLPFTDRISEKAESRSWKAVWIENEYLRVLVLPEIGGRIHAILDKTTGCDLVYNQPVIKPALVGLAGPWISGGIEFNWPQHHRPATFLAVEIEVEKHADGSATIWCSDHDPMSRMKGMHGVCLHPGKALVELKVRAYNRTPLTQTFLWWANVATRVHEAYQSFFPTDVAHVADHARRSMSEYPLARGPYYGVNYAERGRKGIPAGEKPSRFVPPHAGGSAPVDYAANDLSFYANIPVPTSYMCVGSKEDFFGGYDHAAQAGIVHIANHHISPGKKQWTWGNHEFGYAWDRNLTEKDEKGVFGPYIEIMAGVYTDNQPDFSFLQPGETKTWSQYWYPINKIGPAQQANLYAAASLKARDGKIGLGISTTQTFARASIRLLARGETLFASTEDLAPEHPFLKELPLPGGILETDLLLRASDSIGNEIITLQPRPRIGGKAPLPATEPPAPADISTNEELFITGLHLDQYRHATRSPVIYWREALHRDPLDARCNNALGVWHYKRGEFAIAEKHLRHAIQRLTLRNANPCDGEPLYHLGLALRELGRDDDAYAAFYKATWNQAWAGAGFHALAELDCRRLQWMVALEHLDRSLRLDADNLRARNLKVIVLRKLHRQAEADGFLRETLAMDPLDALARHLAHGKLRCDLQIRLDLAHDLARPGLWTEAKEVLRDLPTQETDLPDQSWGARPLIHYTLGWLEELTGNSKAAAQEFKQAAAQPPDYCFPSRIEEISVLEAAMKHNPADPRAPYYLGNLLYDRRRHEEAIRLWEKAAKLDPDFSITWRNLGIGWFNIHGTPQKARTAYDRALKANPSDARLLYERDQLWKRTGEKPAKRLRELTLRLDLVLQRDDLSVELCALYNQAGKHDKALELISSRHFQPWEGGEGGPLGQWTRAHLGLGYAALKMGDASTARQHFAAALEAPTNLGEARHLLANQSDTHYWLGCALDADGDATQARNHWLAAASFKGDFQEMSIRSFSELTCYSAFAWGRLGRPDKARSLFRQLLNYGRELEKKPAKIDYFATSLPTMLLFHENLQNRAKITAQFLQAQALFGLGNRPASTKLIGKVLESDPNHPLASDFSSQFMGKESFRPFVLMRRRK